MGCVRSSLVELGFAPNLDYLEMNLVVTQLSSFLLCLMYLICYLVRARNGKQNRTVAS